MLNPNKITSLRFENLPDLDPVDLYVEEFPGGAARIIVRCWGNAWTHLFEAPGPDIFAFLKQCPPQYIAEKLLNYGQMLRKTEKSHCEWIVQIWKAIAPLIENSKNCINSQG